MKRALRWLGIGLGALVGIVVVLGLVLYLIGSSKVNRTYEVATTSLDLVSDSAGLARGLHLVQIYGCNECHTANFGGQVFADAPPFRVVASNLTRGRGGVGDQYTPELLERAIRHGVGADGKSLLIMPSAAYHGLSDDDVAHIISYLQQVPPVDNELPATRVKPLGRIISAFGFDPTMEVNIEPSPATSPPPGPTPEYGQYLTGLCAYCHGADLRGAQPPDPEAPFAPDLAGPGKWTLDQFKTTLRTGVTPANRELNPQFMPWTVTAHMTDDELTAIHMHLATLTGPAPAAPQ